MVTKDEILHEIERIAAKIGRAPGRQLFQKETGIRQADWHGVFWRSWSDALKDAGYAPNSKQRKMSSTHVLEKYAEAVRHFGRVPAEVDIRMYARGREDFPGHSTFLNHFGSKSRLLGALASLAAKNQEYSDLLPYLPDEPEELSTAEEKSTRPREGFVYLLKSGNHFKIGRSDNLERRIKEIRVALPEDIFLVHSIRTDDPAGIEAYWHKRFVEKRANGEWFRLAPEDVRAFKRRQFQ